MKIGILHPGKMGSSIGIALAQNGHEIFCALRGRSETTRDRARANGFSDLDTIENLSAECDMIFSICMGGGVFPNATSVISAGFKGIYVDANHIGDKSRENHLAQMLSEAGIDYVDSAIYGWPYPHEQNPLAERTIYFYGQSARLVADAIDGDIFSATFLEHITAKDIKRRRESEDRMNCAPHEDYGYGIVYFPGILDVDDLFIDEYMVRRNTVEPHDYTIDDEGFYVNRGGYRFTKEQVEAAPQRFLNLTPDGCPPEDVEFHAKIEGALSKCINAYRGLYPESADCLHWRSDGHIASYGPGAGMGMHHDTAIGRAGNNENPVFNVLSGSLILSDRCTGGSLLFRFIDKSFKPVKGSAVLYPSGFLGSHGVEKVQTGLRISYLEFFGQGTRSGQIKPI